MRAACFYVQYGVIVGKMNELENQNTLGSKWLLGDNNVFAHALALVEQAVALVDARVGEAEAVSSAVRPMVTVIFTSLPSVSMVVSLSFSRSLSMT